MRTLARRVGPLLVALSAAACGSGDLGDSPSGAGGTASATTGAGANGGASHGGASQGGGSQGGAGGAGGAHAGGSHAGGSHAGGSSSGGAGPAVGTYDAPPGVLSNDPYPGFCEPELYAKNVNGETQWFLRDDVASYSDPRARHFYVDYGYVGDTLDYGPIVRGGVYAVRCVRFQGELWWSVPNGVESHVVWFRVPGPMNEAGAVPAPQSFQIADDFAEHHEKLLPDYAPLPGRISMVYRWSETQTPSDLYGHGATHLSAVGNPGEDDPAKLGLTTAMICEAPWMTELGVNPPPNSIDGLGEAVFRSLSDAQVDEAASVQPPVGLYVTDLEKTGNYGDPNTWWSTDLEDATLPRYHRLLAKMKEDVPSRRIGDIYRAIVWSKGFFSPDDGNPAPEHPQWAARLADPRANGLPAPAYRAFTDPADGQAKSLLDVLDLYVVDAYPGRGHGPFDGDPQKSDRSWTVYQIYSMVYDTMIARKLVPAGAKIVWFAWTQSDNDAQGRLYLHTKEGRASYMVRNPTPGWWAQTTQMLGDIVGDGVHWWTEQYERGDDPEKLTRGDGAEQWEPSQPGAPPPWEWSPNPDGAGAYPRHHQYALSYAKLGQEQLSHVAGSLGAWAFAPYTTDDGPSSVPNGEETILALATARQPIVLALGEPGKRAIFAVHPFGDLRKRVTVTAEVDGKKVSLTLAGKWPTVVPVD